MTDLLFIQSQISEVQALIQEGEAAIALRPNSTAIKWNLESLQSRFEDLEQEFLTQSERLQTGICSYRLFDGGRFSNSRKISVFPKVLEVFQHAFSLMYEAYKYGPHKALSDDTRRSTSFELGYSFAGSLGVVLTVQKDSSLLSDYDLYQSTIDSLVTVLEANDSEKIKQASREYGRAAIQAIYKLAKLHVDYDLGADIDWRIGNKVVRESFFQPPQFLALVTNILEIEEETEVVISIVGVLVGLNTRRKTFELLTKSRKLVQGRLTTTIDEQHSVKLPQSYLAKLRIKRVVRYATDDVDEKYELLELTRLGP